MPELPYAYDALEPVICAEIMELHHSKHHAGYVRKLNTAEIKLEEALRNGDVAATVGLHVGSFLEYPVYPSNFLCLIVFLGFNQVQWRRTYQSLYFLEGKIILSWRFRNGTKKPHQTILSFPQV